MRCSKRARQCQARDEWWCNNPRVHCQSARRNGVLGPVQRRDWGKWASRAQFGMSMVCKEARARRNPFTRSSVWCRVASRYGGGGRAGAVVGGVESHSLRPRVCGRRWGWVYACCGQTERGPCLGPERMQCDTTSCVLPLMHTLDVVRPASSFDTGHDATHTASDHA